MPPLLKLLGEDVHQVGERGIIGRRERAKRRRRSWTRGSRAAKRIERASEELSPFLQSCQSSCLQCVVCMLCDNGKGTLLTASAATQTSSSVGKSSPSVMSAAYFRTLFSPRILLGFPSCALKVRSMMYDNNHVRMMLRVSHVGRPSLACLRSATRCRLMSMAVRDATPTRSQDMSCSKFLGRIKLKSQRDELQSEYHYENHAATHFHVA